MNEHEESQIYLLCAIQVIEKDNVSEDVGSHFFFKFNIASIYQKLGVCLTKLNKFKEAFPPLQKSLKIVSKDNLDQQNEEMLFQFAKQSFSNMKQIEFLASVLRDLGFWWMKQSCRHLAAIHLQKSYAIFKLTNSKKITATRLELLTCYLEIYLSESCEIFLL